MEHVENTYRLYHYGSEAKGVFRGPNQQLVCESIPKEDEKEHFDGFLIYNEQAYKRAYKEWQQYWEWMANRNESRWVDQESGKLDFDAKNMSHCMRLMLSSKHILEEGYPIVRFEGEQRKMLMDMKKGEYTYEEIMEKVEKIQKEIEIALQKTHIPEEVDFVRLNALYKHLNQKAIKELG